MNPNSNIFSGTGVAIVTPFRKDESIDFKSLASLVEFQIGQGGNYIVALGTTGESTALSIDEQKAVVETIIETTNKRVPIVVGIGGNNTNEVVSKIKTFPLNGISGILSVAPYYNKPSQKGIYEHYKQIATASSLSVIAYNVPGRTSVNISSDTMLKLASDFKNIVAVKEASGNLVQVMEIIKGKPEGFDVISGDDALTFPILTLGGVGVISVIANVYPAEFSKMVSLCLNYQYKEALKIQYQLLNLMNLLFSEGSPSGVKAALEIKGLVSNHLRLPLVPVSSQLYESIKTSVNNL